MLLPIELFHVCVRIHIDISDIRRDRGRGRSADGAGTCRTRVVPRAGTFPRGSPAPRAGVASAAVWLWVAAGWVCASRGLCVQRRSRPAGIGYLRPPYSYAIVTLTGFISPFVGPAYSYLHTSLLTDSYPWVAVTVADASVSASGAPAHPLVAVRRTPRYQRVRTSVAMSTGCVAMVGWR